MVEGNMEIAESPHNPDIDYERRDVHLRPIALTAGGVLLLLLLTPFILMWSWHDLGADVSRRIRVIPPEPRLQVDPPSELAAYLARQQAIVSSYGWVDRDHGIARVPIRIAMEQALERGIDGFPSGPEETR